MSEQGPAPGVTPETRPYWEAALETRLTLKRCSQCFSHFSFMRSACPGCGSLEYSTVDAAGTATLYSYVIIHRSAPGFEAPFVVAVVRLSEGPLMMTNIVDVDPVPESLILDMPLIVSFREAGDWLVPVFRPEPQ